MKKYLLILLFLSIFILGAFLRLYKLGEAPKGLYIDEAGQGYSAYSLIKTGGKDEFGKFLPIIFRSFNDFKTPVYIYLIVPLIPLFDLTPFTVRFPSFLFSILTFPLLFILVYRLSSEKIRLPLSFIATLLLAISPWHILFGRTNFECNVALFFYLMGIYFFYEALTRPKLFILSSIFFGISFSAYHSQRIITPLTIAFLFYLFRLQLLNKKNIPILLASILLGLLIVYPTLSIASTPGFLSRASNLNIFSHSNSLPAGYIENLNSPLSIFANNPIYLTTKEFLSLYFHYLTPRSMFNLGDYGPRSSFPSLATFFIWQFPFYILGLFRIFKSQDLGSLKPLIIFLLFITPIPAALTRDPYTTIRALPLVIPQLIIISLGLIYTYNLLPKIYKRVSLIIFVLVAIHSSLNVYSSAIVLNDFFRAKEWDYGLEEVAKVISSHKDIPIIVDSSRDDYYIQLLFFLKYDPAKYQQENFEVPLSQYYTNLYHNPTKKIGNIITRNIFWEKDLSVDQILVGDELAISKEQIENHKLYLIKEVFYPDLSTAFRVVRTNPEYENYQKLQKLNSQTRL